MYSSVADCTVCTVNVHCVRHLSSKCAVLLCSWTCSRSLSVITVSTDQLQTVNFLHYLYTLYRIEKNVLPSSALNLTATLSLCTTNQQQYLLTLWLFVGVRGRKIQNTVFCFPHYFLSFRLHVTTGEVFKLFLWFWMFLICTVCNPLNAAMLFKSHNFSGHFAWKPACILLACRA